MNIIEKGLKKVFCLSPIDYIGSTLYRKWIKIKFRNDHMRYKRAENTFYQKYRNKQISILRKKFAQKIEKAKEEIDETDSRLKHEKQKVIWVLWYQGISEAPQLVKNCYESMKSKPSGYEIRLLDENNWSEYVELPNYIVRKFEEGKVSHAFLSDLIRLELLIKYGGTWMDATIMCMSDSMPSYFLESELFMFQAVYADNVNTSSSIENYFITAFSNNKLLRMTQALLYEYWKKYDVVNDYLIFYDMFELAIEAFPEEWEKVIPVSRGASQLLSHIWGRQYDSAVLGIISKQCPFQKLSYRFLPKEIKGTFYEKLSQGQSIMD